MDWEKLFGFETPLLELMLRGSISYLMIFFLLRLVLKREAGSISITDLLVVVLIADAIQNGMAGEYKSITEGLVLVTVIICWSYALNWLGYRFKLMERLIHPPPILLVKDGKMLRYNMRRELITPEELMTQLRKQGIEDVSQVKSAYIEGDGRVSVISEEDKPQRREDEEPI